MGFASTYLEERAIFPQQIEEAVDFETGIIIVVPSYNETGISKLLDSLSTCQQPKCKVEVIIVINAPENATEEALENNNITYNDIQSWKKANKNCFFRLFAFSTGSHSIKGWGVGLARKTGMDEAVRRFNSINKPDGVILNLDADCTVEVNYLREVSEELLNKNGRSACSIYFEHPLPGDEFSSNIIRYITFYELHLRYYYQALNFTGFPDVFHTVGSAIAVKALPYIKAGGMNRKQAGEDFYFIQKLLPAGGYFTLNSTTVFPSPRVSARVPFGTGASIGKMNVDNSSVLLTYNIDAFRELKVIFGMTDTLFETSSGNLKDNFSSLPSGLKAFFNEEEWIEKISEIKNNTSGVLSFKKRFFGWFNMFKIVKYLNFVHTDIFKKIPVEVAASELLKIMGIDSSISDPTELLLYFRKLEK